MAKVQRASSFRRGMVQWSESLGVDTRISLDETIAMRCNRCSYEGAPEIVSRDAVKMTKFTRCPKCRSLNIKILELNLKAKTKAPKDRKPHNNSPRPAGVWDGNT